MMCIRVALPFYLAAFNNGTVLRRSLIWSVFGSRRALNYIAFLKGRLGLGNG